MLSRTDATRAGTRYMTYDALGNKLTER